MKRISFVRCIALCNAIIVSFSSLFPAQDAIKALQDFAQDPKQCTSKSIAHCGALAKAITSTQQAFDSAANVKYAYEYDLVQKTNSGFNQKPAAEPFTGYHAAWRHVIGHRPENYVPAKDYFATIKTSIDSEKIGGAENLPSYETLATNYLNKAQLTEALKHATAKFDQSIQHAKDLLSSQTFSTKPQPEQLHVGRAATKIAKDAYNQLHEATLAAYGKDQTAVKSFFTQHNLAIDQNVLKQMEAAFPAEEQLTRNNCMTKYPGLSAAKQCTVKKCTELHTNLIDRSTCPTQKFPSQKECQNKYPSLITQDQECQTANELCTFDTCKRLNNGITQSECPKITPRPSCTSKTAECPAPTCNTSGCSSSDTQKICDKAGYTYEEPSIKNCKSVSGIAEAICPKPKACPKPEVLGRLGHLQAVFDGLLDGLHRDILPEGWAKMIDQEQYLKLAKHGGTLAGALFIAWLAYKFTDGGLDNIGNIGFLAWLKNKWVKLVLQLGVAGTILVILHNVSCTAMGINFWQPTT